MLPVIHLHGPWRWFSYDNIVEQFTLILVWLWLSQKYSGICIVFIMPSGRFNRSGFFIWPFSWLSKWLWSSQFTFFFLCFPTTEVMDENTKCYITSKDSDFFFLVFCIWTEDSDPVRDVISQVFTTWLSLCPSCPHWPKTSLKGRQQLPDILLLSHHLRDSSLHQCPWWAAHPCCLSQSCIYQGTVICENINKYKSLSRELQYIILLLDNNRPYYLAGRCSCQGNQGWPFLMKTNDLLQRSGKPWFGLMAH